MYAYVFLHVFFFGSVFYIDLGPASFWLFFWHVLTAVRMRGPCCPFTLFGVACGIVCVSI